MKRIFALILAVVVLVGCNDVPVSEESSSESVVAETPITDADTPAPAPRFEHSWQTLYYEKLAENVRSFIPPYFNIYDLDGNGTPELLLSEGTYHMAQCALYTVDNDTLVYLGEYGEYGEFRYDFENNYIHSSYFGMGSYLSVYSFNGNNVTHVISFYDNSNYLVTDLVYEINDESVSEEFYYAELERYTWQWDFTVRKYELSEDTLEDILRAYQPQQ